MDYSFLTLDVFTTRRFGGNPLAVVLDADGLSGEQMQTVTREFNLSETVFVLTPRDPACDVRLRIFTPGRELPFAGHPTVGATLALHSLGRIGDSAVLEEGAGPVPVRIRRGGVAGGASVSGDVLAELTVPRLPEAGPPPPPDDDLAALLGLEPGEIGRGDGRYRPATASAGVPFVIVPLRDREALARARVDPVVWPRLLAGAWATELYLIVPEGDVVYARMFAPALGIAEDPATGAAAAALGGYMAERAEDAGGGDTTLTWTIHQGIEMGRPSVIHLAADLAYGDGRPSLRAVRVAGSAVPVMRGTLTV